MVETQVGHSCSGYFSWSLRYNMCVFVCVCVRESESNCVFVCGCIWWRLARDIVVVGTSRDLSSTICVCLCV